MNPYANEEVMWQRLKDMQREAENSRLFAQRTLPRLLLLLERVWLLAGLAMRRAPRTSARFVRRRAV
ncbi:MAG TPA: hypothetical protein VFR33_06360 [Candidatus Dormibacteraeota bacterium]|nr:hypothetical protein [Candidatus Dormibacteraeota bacterium]